MHACSLRVERHLERQRNDIAALKAMMRQLQLQITALMEGRPSCEQPQSQHQQSVATDADAVL